MTAADKRAAPGSPELSHALTPTSSLLFRFSALTFNAHSIHLDREYARTVEGHRNLLVHGPLSLALMMQFMSSHVTRRGTGPDVIKRIDYRNLAPLYCDEQMSICASKKHTEADGDVYDVWILGPTGGIAVKGTVYTATVSEKLRKINNRKTVHAANIKEAKTRAQKKHQARR